MPCFILKERALIANDLREEGYSFDFADPAPPHFLPQDEEAQALRDKYDAIEVERQRQIVIDAGRDTLATLEPAMVAAIRQLVREEITAEQGPKGAKPAKSKPTDLA